jgi:hypothetical protein
MSEAYDWAFSGRDDAKAEIRVAVRYLLKGAAGTDRDVVALEIMEIMRQAGLPPERRNTQNDAMPVGTAPKP